jgi:hypothetical protein
VFATGIRRKSESTADCCVAAPSMDRETSSGMRVSTSVLDVTLL